MAEKLVASVIRGDNEYREETYQQLDEKGNIVGIYTKIVPVGQVPARTPKVEAPEPEEKPSLSKK